MNVAIVALLLVCSVSHAATISLPKRSVSLSRQFIVFCDDPALRLAVSGFAEETKTHVLNLLAQQDGWKVPIIIHVEPRATNAPGAKASRVGLFETEDGFKIEVGLRLGADPRDVQLRQQLTRAILLEIAYRDRPSAIRAGTSYLDPPVWLVQGLAQMMQMREGGSDSSVFQTLIEGGKVLPLDAFIEQRFDSLDSTSRQLFCFYAMSFVQLLLDQPDGRTSLAALLRGLSSGEEPGAALPKRFPALAGSHQSVEKWWSLGLARLATADRYKGLSVEESERRLAPLLTIQVVEEKTGAPRTFPITEFQTYLKDSQSRAALKQSATSLHALSTRAHPLFRPVAEEYQRIAADLSRGKTSRVSRRLEAAGRYRELVLHRLDDISAYMDWFEATQIPTRSDAFDDYLKTALRADTKGAPRGDAISRYLDEMAQQVQ